MRCVEWTNKTVGLSDFDDFEARRKLDALIRNSDRIRAVRLTNHSEKS